MGERAGQSVELDDDQGVAAGNPGEQPGQFRP
jgi:hypothetical protein